MATKKKSSKSVTINPPKDGTVCARIWAICDKHKGNRQAVLKECASRKINPATATTQYGRWRVSTGFVRPKTAKKGPPDKKAVKKGPPKKKVAKASPAPATPAESNTSPSSE